MANVPEMKRSWTASTFDKDKRAKDAERAARYRRFQEDRNSLRRAARIAHLRGIREKNPQMLTLSRQWRRENTAMGGDNRNVESIRQRILLEEAQRGANTTDIYNALSKAQAQRPEPKTDPTVVAASGPSEKDPNRQQSWQSQTYNPGAMYYGLGPSPTALQSKVISDSYNQTN